MPDPTLVTVKGIAKDVFDPKLKDALQKALTAGVTNFIDNKSGGVLSTKAKTPKSYILTVTLDTLKADNKDKPTRLDAKISILVMTMGTTAKAFSGNTSGAATGISSDVPGEAKDLIDGLLQDLMPKAIKNMPKL